MSVSQCLPERPNLGSYEVMKSALGGQPLGTTWVDPPAPRLPKDPGPV